MIIFNIVIVGEVPSTFKMERVSIKNYNFKFSNISKLFNENRKKWESECQKADIFLIYFNVMCERTLNKLDNV